MTGMWDKFYVLKKLLEQPKEKQDQKKLEKFKECLSLLGEVLQASSEHMNIKSKWLKDFHKVEDPVPIALCKLAKTPEKMNIVGSGLLVLEILSELHGFDHKDLSFHNRSVYGHYTEAFIVWVATSRSKKITLVLKEKAKRLIELDRDYDLWNPSRW